MKSKGVDCFMKAKKNIKELIWYIVAGVFLLFGLSLMVTGIVGEYLPGLEKNNPILRAETQLKGWSKLGFMSWGMIFLVVGAIVFVSVLLYYAKKTDIERDRALKRAQRLGE